MTDFFEKYGEILAVGTLTTTTAVVLISLSFVIIRWGLTIGCAQ